jgi:hypothetical protein
MVCIILIVSRCGSRIGGAATCATRHAKDANVKRQQRDIVFEFIACSTFDPVPQFAQ